MDRPRGSYPVGERRREQILETTERLVARDGHQSVTLKHIADEIGVTVPAIYHHFPSKDVLLVELLRFRDQRARAYHFDDPVDGLIAAVRHSATTPRVMELYVDFSSRAADRAHPAHDYFRDRYESLTARLAEVVATSGSALPIAPDAAARILLALADGLQARWLVSRDFDLGEPLADLKAVWTAAAGTHPGTAAPAHEPQ